MLTYLFFAAAVASNPPTTANAQPAQQPAKKERMICKSDDFVGSRIPRRVCKTEMEWAAGRKMPRMR